VTKQEVNKILCQYEKTIKSSINKVNIDLSLLTRRCVTIQDIQQEVYIKLWHLLETVYEPKYDLTTFIEFQSAWNAKKIVSNLRRSARCFTGSLSMSKKSGSQQAKIDDRKFSLNSNYRYYHTDNEYYLNCDDEYTSGYAKKEKAYLPDALIDNSYQYISGILDNEYIITAAIKQLDEMYDKDIYSRVLIFILNNQDKLCEKNLCETLMKEFNYKSVLGIRNILHRIYSVVYSILDDYNNI
jgi:hypothetical protein